MPDASRWPRTGSQLARSQIREPDPRDRRDSHRRRRNLNCNWHKSLTMHIRLAYITMEMLEHNRIACTATIHKSLLTWDSEITLLQGHVDWSLREIKDWIEYETDQQKMLPARPRRLPLLDKQGMQSRRHGKQNDGQKSAIRLGSARRQWGAQVITKSTRLFDVASPLLLTANNAVKKES